MSNAPGGTSDLTWEWTLGSGETIVARVDPMTFVESVYVGARLVSRSGREGKPEGHDVPLAGAGAVAGSYRAGSPQEIRATYDAARCSFELRTNGQIVAPSRAPATPPPEVAPGRVYGNMFSPRYRPMQSLAPMPQRSESGAARIVLSLFVLVVVGGFVLAGVRGYVGGARRGAETPAGSKGASNGLAVVHYPAGFKVTETTKTSSTPAGRDDNCPERKCVVEASLIKVEHATRDEGVLIASFKTNGLRIGLDPWRISNFLFKEFQDFTKVHGANFIEGDRRDATCLGEPGAVVIGRFHDKGENGTIWSCTFIRDGNAYWVTYFTNEKNAADEPDLKKVIDATELKSR